MVGVWSLCFLITTFFWMPLSARMIQAFLVYCLIPASPDFWLHVSGGWLVLFPSYWSSHSAFILVYSAFSHLCQPLSYPVVLVSLELCLSWTSMSTLLLIGFCVCVCLLSCFVLLCFHFLETKWCCVVQTNIEFTIYSELVLNSWHPSCLFLPA